ncbi:hypothetical protein BH24ACT7_BH24ACT7_22550 [soil metagenome]
MLTAPVRSPVDFADLEAGFGFLRGGARPPTEMTVAFIDTHRDEFGVEPICTTLQVAPSTYYAAKNRPLSARALRDAVMIPILVALWMANRKLYGAHKLWKAARRAGHDIGRDQVARLMRHAGIEGVTRQRRVRTTRPDPTAQRHPDLVTGTSPPPPPTSCGWSTSPSLRRGQGWRTCVSSPTPSRGCSSGGGWRRTCAPTWSSMRWRWHGGGAVPASRPRVAFRRRLPVTSIRYGERLDEIGAVPSIGSVGDRGGSCRRRRMACRSDQGARFRRAPGSESFRRE